MQLCKISDAAPGMVLARPIRNPEGAVLCPAGLELTDMSIRRLQRTGVETFFVEGGDEIGPTPEERIAELTRRFQGISDPVMLQIKDIVENHFRGSSAQTQPGSTG